MLQFVKQKMLLLAFVRVVTGCLAGGGGTGPVYGLHYTETQLTRRDETSDS